MKWQCGSVPQIQVQRHPIICFCWQTMESHLWEDSFKKCQYIPQNTWIMIWSILLWFCTGHFYSYPLWSHCCYWVIAPVPIRQLWRIWVNGPQNPNRNNHIDGLRVLHTGVGGVRAGPHCRIRMRETVHTGAGYGAESREHFFILFVRFQSSTMTKWAGDSWPSQDKAFTSNLMQAPLSLYIRNFQILKISP